MATVNDMDGSKDGRLDDDLTRAGIDALLNNVAAFLPELELDPSARIPADTLVAFGEGRLLPHEEAALVSALAHDQASRSEVRALFPERAADVFGEPRDANRPTTGENVVPFPAQRRVINVAGTAAAAAALAAAIVVFVQPPSPPVGGGVDVVHMVQANTSITRDRKTRSPAARKTRSHELHRGEHLFLSMNLGTPSRFDRWLRGAEPWGALVAIDARGKSSVICTSDDTLCHPGEGVMSFAFAHENAAHATGEWRLFFATSGRPPADLHEFRRRIADASDPSDPARAATLAASTIKGAGKFELQRPISVWVQPN